MAYNGFHTQQERDDYMTTQINNPNRVGSGFINLGPQQRFAQPTAAANWQTNSLVGGAPAGHRGAPQGVADIWNPAPPKPPMAAAPLSQPPAFAQPPPPHQYPPQDQTVNQLFNQVGGVDFNAGAPRGRQPAPPRPNPNLMQAPPNLAPPTQGQPFMNGGGGGGGRRGGPPQAPPQAAPPGANLMSMLNTVPAPAVAPQAPAAPFARNGGVPPPGNAPRMQAFAQIPPVPTGKPNYNQTNGSARGAAPAAPAAPPPQKKPQTITDYAAAAQSYRAPTAPKSASAAGSQSVSRKAESEGSSTSAPGGGGGGGGRTSEWECSRCTFLNHASLAECEMCGAERPGGKPAAPATSARANASAGGGDGWQTAARNRQPTVGGGGGQAAAAADSGKSQAQKKNEKRRAKKRAES